MVSSELSRVPTPPAGRRFELSPTTWGLLTLAILVAIVVLAAFVPGIPAPSH